MRNVVGFPGSGWISQELAKTRKSKTVISDADAGGISGIRIAQKKKGKKIQP
jgi:hypothetical protein